MGSFTSVQSNTDHVISYSYTSFESSLSLAVFVLLGHLQNFRFFSTDAFFCSCCFCSKRCIGSVFVILLFSPVCWGGVMLDCMRAFTFHIDALTFVNHQLPQGHSPLEQLRVNCIAQWQLGYELTISGLRAGWPGTLTAMLPHAIGKCVCVRVCACMQ